MADEASRWRPLNINTMVRVMLTEAGRDRLRQSRERTNALIPEGNIHILPLTPELDADGYYQASLWSLMRDFGEDCFHGAPVLFENSIIHVHEG